MKWLEVQINTNHAGLEAVETMLSAHGIDGVVIDDETEFEDFLENNHQYWDYVDEDLRQEMQGRSRITFYLEAGDEGFAKLGEVRIALEELKKARADCGTLLMTLDDLEDADWENNWKQYYKPMEIGDRLLVVPEWLREDPKVQAGLRAGRVPLVLDPGLTFGTGSHATTRLCLTALEKTIHGGERVLEVRGEYLPIVELWKVFNVAGAKTEATQGIVVILQSGGRRYALLVDQLIGQHQVVVKNLESNYRKVPGISAATILGDGSVALIVDVSALQAINREQRMANTAA